LRCDRVVVPTGQLGVRQVNLQSGKQPFGKPPARHCAGPVNFADIVLPGFGENMQQLVEASAGECILVRIVLGGAFNASLRRGVTGTD
jgi:hypothetical protein